jgi:pSer/pThr/pTyr-binding forkhead associated (FHA) protein
MSRSLTIGSRPDCDLVVSVPSVSGLHCRLTADEAGYFLEDLGSTNGTYFNGQRIAGRARISLAATDTIHLGTHSLPIGQVLARIDREPAPSLTLLGSEMVVGRNSSCDHVIDLPMVSSQHARLFREGDRILLEDLHSSNGTFVNGNRVEGPVDLKPGDLIGLGSYTLRLEVGPRAGVAVDPGGRLSSPASQPVSTAYSETEDSRRSPSHREPTRAVIASHAGRLAALLVQAPIVAMLIVGLTGTASPAPLLFWLGLAATWFGLSTAVIGDFIDPVLLRLGLTPAGARTLLARLLVLVVLCALQCLIAWLIVGNMAELRAPGGATLAFLLMASAVGLALGLIIVAVVPRPSIAWAVLPATMAFFWVFGGGWQPLPRMPAAAGVVSGFVPSRWTFEGLLLLESDQRRGTASTEGSDPTLDRELAEDYFPAETDRMGVKADAMALVAMLVGLSAAALFISASSKPVPSAPRAS